MLTRLVMRNFKRFGEAEVELANPVVLIGPNNSGKTTALQALALWHAGLQLWSEKRAGTSAPEKRPGVAVNRRDLVSLPVPAANLLWHELRTRNTHRVDGRQRTENIRVEIVVEGVGPRGSWQCGLEFDYANEESLYCRPLRAEPASSAERMPIPDEAHEVEVAFLPPMSGLTGSEVRLDRGAIDVRIGEGRTAEVLRNLCYRVHEEAPERWIDLSRRVDELFGAEIEAPRYVTARGEITMRYRELGTWLDLSSSGRGFQQTLLLLAYMYANEGAVLLLDEPDAHLEILRQRQTYRVINDVAAETGSQIVAASHSEVLLNEAAGSHAVVAFVGRPHRIDDRGSQLLKSLRDIGFEQYALAEAMGWVLYLEGSTDLAILQAFADRLGHDDAKRALAQPFVHYVGNQLPSAQRHFFGLREALPQLRGVVLLDEHPGEGGGDDLECLAWHCREIENYLCSPATLEAFAEDTARGAVIGQLWEAGEVERRQVAMSDAAAEVESALRTLRQISPWDPDTKVSDDFLTPLFASYFEKLNLPNLMLKRSFYELADHVPLEDIDPEVTEKLDAIAQVASVSGASQ
ncbi:ATP-dependent nuclease [Candidatus Poriferisodalis sp.]|uniref:ATP-dependent nuclease n=1 Tax=Candidatus Poriferisodalis sp. TaxID=3101277 RepID=UPI003B02A5AC